MLKIKLTNFVAKRVLIYCIILSIFDIILLENRWYILAGLIFGSAFGVLKFGGFSWLFERLIPAIGDTSQKAGSARLGMMGFIVNQMLLFPLLLAAYFFNRWVFAGIVAGILLVPMVLMLNSLTEAFRITSNNFE